MQSLSERMEFDHVIRVHADGSITEPTCYYAPEVYDDEVGAPWSLMTGYTGQYGYNGPTLHSSEFIGGGLERDILAKPGLYVAVVSHVSDPSDLGNDDIAGWCVAYIADE